MLITNFLSELRARIASLKYEKTGKWPDKSFGIMLLRAQCARLLVNMLSNTVAEYEVRRVGLDMRGRKVCKNELSINSCVGT